MCATDKISEKICIPLAQFTRVQTDGTQHCVFIVQPLGLNLTEDVEAVEELRRQLRQRYINIVVVAAVDSADAVDQVNAVMTSLLQRRHEINLVAQVCVFVLFEI